MKTHAKFEKVSLGQFITDWRNTYPGSNDSYEYIRSIYTKIQIPKRSTSKSAGYDFFLPEDIEFDGKSEIMIPTGIRCVNMADDEVLMIFPRSSLGVRHRLVPSNLTGIIDADYASPKNEGHIFMKILHDNDGFLELDAGCAFCQGIITRYCTTVDDAATGIRNGGIGSTDIK